MRTNHMTGIVAAATGVAMVAQALVAPAAAMAQDFGNEFNGIVRAVRSVTPSSSIVTKYPGTILSVQMQVSGIQASRPFVVYDHFMTADLAEQGFVLMLDSEYAPRAITRTDKSVAVTPLISADGKTLGFALPSGLAPGSVAGISYYLHSTEDSVYGNHRQRLIEWANETENGKSKHFGDFEVVFGANSSGLQQLTKTGDPYSEGDITVHFDTTGGETLTDIVIPKAYANNLGTQMNQSPKRDGYEFAGWFFDPNLTQPFTAEGIPNHDFTLYAKWEPDSSYFGVTERNTATAESASTTLTQAGSPAVSAGAGTGYGSGTAGSKTASQQSKGNLAPTGAADYAGVIVVGAAVASGLGIVVLRRRARR